VIARLLVHVCGVGLSVCLLVAAVNCGKTANSIEMPSVWGCDWDGPGKQCVTGRDVECPTRERLEVVCVT